MVATTKLNGTDNMVKLEYMVVYDIHRVVTYNWKVFHYRTYVIILYTFNY